MFTIIGGDGKEYGPVSAEQVRTWLASGRANLTTRAKAVGTEEWRTLGEFAEFGGPPPLAGVPSSVPPAFIGTDLELADRGSRLVAKIIDWMLSFVAYAPGMVLIGPTFFHLIMAAQHGERPDFESINGGAALLGFMLICVLGLILLVVQLVMLSTRGQTIGKRIMGIKIVTFPDNADAGFVKAWLLRSFVVRLAEVILNFAFYLGTIGMIVDVCFIFRDDRRCIHDLIAGTHVIKAKKP